MKRVKAIRIKKNNQKRTTMDLFPDDEVFNFKNDQIDKVIKKNNLYKRPDNFEKWKSRDFLSCVYEKLKTSQVGCSSFDINLLSRLRDRLTRNWCLNENDNELKCNNTLLKTYLDWWVDTYRDFYEKQKSLVSTQYFCTEECVREFFQTSLWRGLKTSHVNPIKRSLSKPTLTTPKSLYANGGIKKLVYEIGIIDSVRYLVQEEHKQQPEIIREVRRALVTMHNAVFKHVVEKTLRFAPYDSSKKFDVINFLKPVFLKQGVDMSEYRWEKVFDE